MNSSSTEPLITSQQVRGQLVKDLIGKDSHRGVTLTYTWLANQFGHFSLGFIPTWIFTVLLGKESSIRVVIGVSAVWLLFEAYNLIGPIWLRRRFKSIVRFRQKVCFEPDTRNLAYDTTTDLVFFWLGSCTAGLIIHQTLGLWIAIGLLVGYIIYAAPYWYRTKIYLQAAQYPFQFRLGQWDKAIDDHVVKAVEKFRNEKDPGNHLFVFGPGNTGKSILCVGVATEMSIKHIPCLYTTAMKLFRLFFDAPETERSSDIFWTWREARYLVIDDVNTGDPVRPDLIMPERFSEFLKNKQFEDVNIQAVREKNVIWVMGTEAESIDRHENWENLLKELGVDDSKITAVNLDPNFNIGKAKVRYGYRTQSLPSELGSSH